jgi:hypothetical protein
VTWSKKLVRGPIPCSGENSLFRQNNSLFHCVGNFAASH